MKEGKELSNKIIDIINSTAKKGFNAEAVLLGSVAKKLGFILMIMMT